MNVLIKIVSLVATAGIPVVPSAQPVAVPGLQGLGETRHHTFESTLLERGYDILVGLPESYSAADTGRYPVLYILDGGELYPLLKGYYRYLRHGGETPELILVAVSYGSSDWQNGNERSHDYTAPSEEREFWGGASDFQAFLSDELMPFIATRYRTRNDRRIVFGQSLGGQFVLFTAQTRPGLFWGHIASNPALHRNLPWFLSTRPESPDTTTSLFVASASEDDPQFRQPAQAWSRHWSGVQNRPWHLRVETLQGHNHFSAPPAAFRRGLRWLFAQ